MRLRTPRDVGLAIRERRRALGLDQKALAERVGVSRQWIIAVEKGKRRAELWLVLRTFGALDLALRVDDSPPQPAGRTAVATEADLGRLLAAHRRGGRARP